MTGAWDMTCIVGKIEIMWSEVYINLIDRAICKFKQVFWSETQLSIQK